jgi:peptide methionine sulfoxide reductase msrA/msrB
METAIFAGGCFWGVEHHMKNLHGVISTTVGYIGGNTENPTYEEVCQSYTGHAEAIKIVFDPKQVNYETITKLFFEIHDPEQVDRQGPDVGIQYRSEIFYLNETQKQIAQKLISELMQKGYNVATKLTKATEFYPAENYHQDYYRKTGKLPYCHFYKKKF